MQKTVLVTGGSGGIGKEIVKRLAMENYKVITCARSIEKLQIVSLELKAIGLFLLFKIRLIIVEFFQFNQNEM